MSKQFTVSINGAAFPIACDKNEEERVKTLATYVDEKAQELKKKMGGRVNDLHIMALVAILLADELTDTLDEKDKLLKKNPELGQSDDLTFTDPKFSKALSMLASRMENIAGTLEGKTSDQQH